MTSKSRIHEISKKLKIICGRERKRRHLVEIKARCCHSVATSSLMWDLLLKYQAKPKKRTPSALTVICTARMEYAIVQLSYTRQLPTESSHSFLSHKTQVLSISVPKRIGPGIDPANLLWNVDNLYYYIFYD